MPPTTHPSQQRLACERCRRQKLKCTRLDPAEASCSRCFRLRTPCRTGDQGRIGRPSKRDATSPEPNRAIESPAAPLNSDILTTSNQASETAVVQVNHFLNGIFGTGLRRHEEALVVGAMSPTFQDMLGESQIEVGPIIDSIFWDTMTTSSIPQLQMDDFMLPSDPVVTNPTSDITQAGPSVSRNGEGLHDFLKILSRINIDLHANRDCVHLRAIESKAAFCAGFCTNPEVNDEGIAVVERTLVLSQEFLQEIAKMSKQIIYPQAPALAAPQGQNQLAENHEKAVPEAVPEQPSSESQLTVPATLQYPHQKDPRAQFTAFQTPLALVIISAYVQILELFEISMVWVHMRLQTIQIDPLKPIEGLAFGALQLADGYLQIAVFTEIVSHTMDKIDKLLGIAVVDSPQKLRNHTSNGLLTRSRRLPLLYSELRSPRDDWSPRPAMLRESIKAAKAIILEASLA
jgi:hypothetical protein